MPTKERDAIPGAAEKKTGGARAGAARTAGRNVSEEAAAARQVAAAGRTRGVTWSRAMFYSHLWFGVLLTVVLMVISVTGVLLNHKRGLGLMPNVEHSPSGAFSDALPLSELARRAFGAAGIAPEVGNIDRMDVRPRDGIVKIRFRDAANTEATVDINDGSILHLGSRGDVFMEKLHSGEIFGENGILLSDVGAIGLAILLISGYWLWLRPRSLR